MAPEIKILLIVHRRDAEYAEKFHALKPVRHYMILDINKLSGKIIGPAIEACIRPLVLVCLNFTLLNIYPVKCLPNEM